MRTLTARESNLVGRGNLSHHIRVEIDRNPGGSPDWVDMSDFLGYDWVVDLGWSDSIDNNMVGVEISLWASNYNRNLSPYVTGQVSAAGSVVDNANPIRVSTAVMGALEIPRDADYIEIFSGEIEDFQIKLPTIKIRALDGAEALYRLQVENLTRYPAAPKSEVAVEDACQDILDDWAPGVTLYSPNGTGSPAFAPADSPGFNVRTWIQKKESVMDALQNLVQATGYTIRYKWHVPTSAFQLQLFQIERFSSDRGTITLTGQCGAGETFEVNGTTFTEGTDFDRGTDVDIQISNMVTAINSTLGSVVTAWRDFRRSARGTITVTGDPAAGDQFILDTTTYTEGIEWNRTVGDVRATAKAIGEAIRNGPDTAEVTGYSFPEVVNGALTGNAYVNVQAKFSGAWEGSTGNSIVFAPSGPGMTNCTFDGSGFLGGNILGLDRSIRVQAISKGSSGITFTESLTNATIDGFGFLGGTISGVEPSPALVVDESNILGTPNWGAKRSNVRNVVKLTFGYEPEKRVTINLEDAASIAKYGRSPVLINEHLTTPIDRSSEAYTLAGVILDDLKEPSVEGSIEVPFLPWIEPGDYLTLTADGIHFDTDQDLAVVSFRHSISAKKAVSQIALRGKPAGGFDRWRSYESRGLAPAPDDYVPTALDNIEVTPGAGSYSLRIDHPYSEIYDPPIRDWDHTRVFLDTSTLVGETLDETDDRLIARGKAVRFDLTGLVPGITYYVAIQLVTACGNVSNTSYQEFVATQKVGPYHVNEEQEQGIVLNPNPDFNTYTLGTELPPDSWGELLGGSTWLGNIEQTTTDNNTGTNSILVDADSMASLELGGLISEYFPVTGDGIYGADLTYKFVGTPAISDSIFLRAFVYDKDKVQIGAGLVNLSSKNLNGTTAGMWTKLTGFMGDGVTGWTSAVRYMRIVFYYRTSSAPSSITDVYFDSCRVRRVAPSFEATVIGANVNTGTWTAVNYSTEIYDYGSVFNLTSDLFTAPYDARYQFSAEMDYPVITSGTNYRYRWVKNGTPLATSAAFTAIAANDAPAVAENSFDLVAGDTMAIEVWHNDGTSPRIIDVTFRGRQVIDLGGA